LTEQQAGLLVKYNAFADDYEDLAAAAVRGAAMPHSHVGLWPQFALFNHSCLPNTVHYLVGHAMVVRAVEDVPAGQWFGVSVHVSVWACWGGVGGGGVIGCFGDACTTLRTT
jgi:hypothetical protein